jgi:phage shock protein PspC (stress-responsive transcriptional regulator)
MKKLLFRKRDLKVAGVCGGLGEYFNIDQTVFRVLFFVGIFTPYPSILTYILLWIVIPKEPKY